MNKKIIFLALLACCIPATGFAASFDCAKAATNVEKLICGDESVSKLDEQLSSVYKQALDKTVDKDTLKKEQISWLKNRNACADAACLTKSYQTRIEVLDKKDSAVTPVTENTSQEFSTAAEKKKKIVIITGSQNSLCTDYLELLNRVPLNPKNTCGLEYSFDETAKKQGFSDISWEEVDPKKYEDMLLKYWMYANKDFNTEEQKIEKRKEFYKVFLPMDRWLWHARFDIGNNGKPVDVYKLVSRDCVLDNASFFVPSDKGFSSTKSTEIIDIFARNIFIYRGKVFTSFLDHDIRETTGDGTYLNAGLAVCEFKSMVVH